MKYLILEVLFRFRILFYGAIGVYLYDVSDVSNVVLHQSYFVFGKIFSAFFLPRLYLYYAEEQVTATNNLFSQILWNYSIIIIIFLPLIYFYSDSEVSLFFSLGVFSAIPEYLIERDIFSKTSSVKIWKFLIYDWALGAVFVVSFPQSWPYLLCLIYLVITFYIAAMGKFDRNILPISRSAVVHGFHIVSASSKYSLLPILIQGTSLSLDSSIYWRLQIFSLVHVVWNLFGKRLLARTRHDKSFNGIFYVLAFIFSSSMIIYIIFSGISHSVGLLFSALLFLNLLAMYFTFYLIIYNAYIVRVVAACFVWFAILILNISNDSNHIILISCIIISNTVLTIGGVFYVKGR